MNRYFLGLIVSVFVGGCATTANYAFTQEEEAGQVAISYVTQDLETPPLSSHHANLLATRQCQRLGYSYTELNVQVAQQCSVDGDSACASWQVEKTYQCAGNTIAEPQNQSVPFAMRLDGGHL